MSLCQSRSAYLSQVYLLYFAVNSTGTGRNVAPTAPPAWKLAIQRTSVQNHPPTFRRMQISVIFVILTLLRVIPQKHLVATRWRNHTSVIYVIRSLHLKWIWSVTAVYIPKVRVINVMFVMKSFLWVLLSEFTLWVIWGWRHTNVMYVWGNLLEMKSWKSIILRTQVRSHISVMFVAKISLRVQICKDINARIVGRSHINVIFVGRHSPEVNI